MVRRVLADSFIVARDEAGVVRVMFNMCLHRGMQVCRAEMGNASHFRCPYHAWTYRNDGRLAGLPFHGEAYGGEDGFAPRRPVAAARAVDGHLNGLIFVSLDPDAPPLRDYLGDFAFYLDYYTRQSPAGIELRGPQRWRVKANWKIGAENFAGDGNWPPPPPGDGCAVCLAQSRLVGGATRGARVESRGPGDEFLIAAVRPSPASCGGAVLDRQCLRPWRPAKMADRSACSATSPGSTCCWPRSTWSRDSRFDEQQAAARDRVEGHRRLPPGPPGSRRWPGRAVGWLLVAGGVAFLLSFGDIRGGIWFAVHRVVRWSRPPGPPTPSSMPQQMLRGENEQDVMAEQPDAGASWI